MQELNLEPLLKVDYTTLTECHILHVTSIPMATL